MKKIWVLSILIAFAAVIFVGIFIYIKHDAKNAIEASKDTHINAVTSSPTPSVSSSITVSPTGTENTCNDLLVLVDRTYALPSDYVPPDLVNLGANGIPVTSNSLVARSILIPDLKRLFVDADTAGINLVVDSPYRSYATQASVYNGYVAQSGKAAADQFSAEPGHSQHQLGTAIDFSTASLGDQLDQSFANTPAGEWLLANSYKYGFYIAYPEGKESVTGYEYEPWHFRYIGIQNALDLKNSGLDMETYLLKYGVKPNCS